MRRRVIIYSEDGFMRQKITLLKNGIAQMNKISRTYIKYGNLLVLTAFLLTAVCQAFLGRAGNYDELLYLRGEFYTLFRDSFAAIYVPALLTEIVRRMLIIDGYI